MKIIWGDAYENYQNALEISNLENLDCRRENLCLKFAKRASEHPKFRYWFKLKPKLPTRLVQGQYCNPIARTDRLMKGPISYLTRLLNSNSEKLAHGIVTKELMLQQILFKVNYSDSTRRLVQTIYF